MNEQSQNLKMLEEIIENTEMGKNTLEQILPMTTDKEFRDELLREQSIYHDINTRAHEVMAACGGEAKGQSTFAKVNTKLGITMKTINDKSTRNFAQMLAQGSEMGVVDCIKCEKDYPNASIEAKEMCTQLKQFQENSSNKMQSFL